MLSFIRKRLAWKLTFGYMLVCSAVLIVVAPLIVRLLGVTLLPPVGTGLAVVLVLLAGLIFSLRVTRPLRRITAAARRFSGGDFDARVRPRGEDEVAELARAFNQMADQLNEKIRQVETGRNQIQGILEGMVEGVVVVGPSEELLLINSAAREILAVDHPAKPGSLLSEVTRVPEIQELIRAVFETGRPQLKELTVYAPVERILRAQAAPYAAGSAPGVLLVMHDITDIKRLEQLRKEFVANVSHELKTPLAAIRGSVETLLDGALQDPAHNRLFVKAIAEESGRLDRLVDDLLTLAQIESRQELVRREPIVVKTFLEQELQRYLAVARKTRVSLEWSVDPEALSLLADRQQLVQAIGNLVDNAIKYNHPEGTVRVQAFAQGTEICFRVDDSGRGIPEDELPRIFERFYRVDKDRSRETGGTGLGLAIVKHVAESHGGSVQVVSRPGSGSCFILRFPALQNPYNVLINP